MVMNKKGFVWIVALVFIAWLVFDIIVFHKPFSIWLTEKATNTTLMKPIDLNLTNITQKLNNLTLIQ